MENDVLDNELLTLAALDCSHHWTWVYFILIIIMSERNEMGWQHCKMHGPSKT